MKPKLTYSLALAAARDEANRHMRARAAGAAAGRTCWTLADYNVAVETFEKLWPETRDPQK